MRAPRHRGKSPRKATPLHRTTLLHPISRVRPLPWQLRTNPKRLQLVVSSQLVAACLP